MPLSLLSFQKPLNQRVPGSSPGAPTKVFNILASVSEDQRERERERENVLTHFEFAHGVLGKAHVAAEIVLVSSMIRKSGNRLSLATNAERVCAEIMLKQTARA